MLSKRSQLEPKLGDCTDFDESLYCVIDRCTRRRVEKALEQALRGRHHEPAQQTKVNLSVNEPGTKQALSRSKAVLVAKSDT